MLRPAIADLITGDQNVFSLVIAVAKRARELTDEIEEQKKILIENNGGKMPTEVGDFEKFLDSKPVKLAIEEFAEHKISFVSTYQDNGDDEFN